MLCTRHNIARILGYKRSTKFVIQARVAGRGPEDDEYRKKYYQKNVDSLNKLFYKKNFSGDELRGIIQKKWGSDFSVEIVNSNYVKIYESGVIDTEDYVKTALLLEAKGLVDVFVKEVQEHKDKPPILINLAKKI
jgi:hypothetical protein